LLYYVKKSIKITLD